MNDEQINFRDNLGDIFEYHDKAMVAIRELVETRTSLNKIDCDMAEFQKEIAAEREVHVDESGSATPLTINNENIRKHIGKMEEFVTDSDIERNRISELHLDLEVIYKDLFSHLMTTNTTYVESTLSRIESAYTDVCDMLAKGSEDIYFAAGGAKMEALEVYLEVARSYYTKWLEKARNGGDYKIFLDGVLGENPLYKAKAYINYLDKLKESEPHIRLVTEDGGVV